MATARNTAKVGAAVLIALVLFGAMWAFFLQQSVLSKTYNLDVLFNDATGIDAGAPVQQAGVQIGVVDAVVLQGSKADLKLKINQKVNGKPFRIVRGAQFIITTPLLGSTGVLSVVPAADAYRRAGDIIQPGASDLRGTRTADITASIARANALVDELTITAKSANTLLADKRLQSNLLQIVDNIDAASRGGAKLTDKLSRTLDADNAQVLQLLHETQAGSRQALGNIVDTTGQLRGLTTQNKAQLNEIIANLRDTTASVAGLTEQANGLLKNGNINQNLSATVANLKATTDKLTTITGNIQALTGDAAVQGNLKATVQNLRDTTENTASLTDRLNRLVGGKKKASATVLAVPGGPVIIAPGKTPIGGPQNNKIFVPLIAPRVDFVQNTRDNHFRVDVDAIVPVGGSTPGLFGRIGVYGLGDSSSAGKLILQGGQALGPTGLLDGRVGLYQSKLSVGGDLGLGRRNTLSVDIYDANKPHVDARAIVKITPALGIIAGGEDLTRRASPLVGLEYRSSK